MQTTFEFVHSYAELQEPINFALTICKPNFLNITNTLPPKNKGSWRKLDYFPDPSGRRPSSVMKFSNCFIGPKLPLVARVKGYLKGHWTLHKTLGLQAAVISAHVCFWELICELLGSQSIEKKNIAILQSLASVKYSKFTGKISEIISTPYPTLHPGCDWAGHIGWNEAWYSALFVQGHLHMICSSLKTGICIPSKLEFSMYADS